MSLRVILADDHPFVLLGIRSSLDSRAGVSIVGEAIEPASLIGLLQSTPCDVLVTDLAMPESAGGAEDGLRLVRRIRSDWPALRIVVLTTSTNAAILRAIVANGAISVLGKAESMDALWDAIEATAAGRTHIGQSIRDALEQPQEEPGPLPLEASLSAMQAQIVHMLVGGQSIAEIAAALGCHRRTVSRQKREAMVRLGVTNDPGLFSYVRAHGLRQVDSYI